ncbi:L-asparagine permease [Mycobacterium tuberculosis]|uniref:L-asparagine permease n=12 Tax=Mycobacterium tuberculosis TaxID=1773 RepID=A0A655ADL6_MYCTX|nr:L-asparagine permease [Mycobacterium tuberculosis]CKP86945.1 L-asparagine permease [Mycobacterium tuberculosis]CKS74348.1 L-asparagine permease [Mycobacterium tuberculosis]
MSALGIIAGWATIVLCQLRLHKLANAGIMQRPRFRMPFSPYSGYLTLLFLLVVLVTMASDKPIGTWTVATLIIVIPALTAGWYLVRKRVMAVARERLGHTGPFPAVANPPVRSRD